MRRFTPIRQEQQAFVLQKGKTFIGQPFLCDFTNDANQCLDRLLPKPVLFIIQTRNNTLQLLLSRISFQSSPKILNVQMRVRLYFRPFFLLKHQLGGKNIPTSSDLRFLQPSDNTEPLSRTSIRTRRIFQNADIICQYYIARIRMRNRSYKFKHPFLSRRKDTSCNGIAGQDFHIRRGMLTATGTIRIIQPHLLCKSINVDDIFRTNAKAPR